MVRHLLESESCDIFISVATLWKLLLKAQKGKLGLGDHPAKELRTFCRTLRGDDFSRDGATMRIKP